MRTQKKPDKAFPSWIPLPETPWRLVCPGPGGRQAFVRDSEGYSLQFKTAPAALKYLEEHDIELWKPWEDPDV